MDLLDSDYGTCINKIDIVDDEDDVISLDLGMLRPKSCLSLQIRTRALELVMEYHSIHYIC